MTIDNYTYLESCMGILKKLDRLCGVFIGAAPWVDSVRVMVESNTIFFVCI